MAVEEASAAHGEGEDRDQQKQGAEGDAHPRSLATGPLFRQDVEKRHDDSEVADHA